MVLGGRVGIDINEGEGLDPRFRGNDSLGTGIEIIRWGIRDNYHHTALTISRTIAYNITDTVSQEGGARWQIRLVKDIGAPSAALR